MSDQEVLPSPAASESLSNIELDPTADKGQTFLICYNEGFIISTLSSRLASETLHCSGMMWRIKQSCFCLGLDKLDAVHPTRNPLISLNVLEIFMCSYKIIFRANKDNSIALKFGLVEIF